MALHQDNMKNVDICKTIQKIYERLTGKCGAKYFLSIYFSISNTNIVGAQLEIVCWKDIKNFSQSQTDRQP